jgi:hypothetical protein
VTVFRWVRAREAAWVTRALLAESSYMFGFKSAVQIGGAKARPFREWLERHPRRYRDVAPILVCPHCHAGNVLTPDLQTELQSHPVPCPRCGEGVFSKAPFDGHAVDGTNE